MITLLFCLMFFFMLLGFPMMIGIIAAPLICLAIFEPQVALTMVIQQMFKGVSGYVMLCVPMFMLAGDIMCHGEMAGRLIGFVRSLVSHKPGGLAITAGGTCSIFGAISGSTQATLVAIGKPMYPSLIDAGYSESHAIALLMSNANIAALIPPSVVMIMYCVSVGESVGELFMTGIWPGIFMFLCFATYEVIYAKRHHLASEQKASFKEQMVALKKAVLPMGFPVLVLGGIYSGLFSPTEAAAASVLYAMILEGLVYRTLSFKKMLQIGKNTATISGALYILMAGGAAFSWLISYARIPHYITENLFSSTPSPTFVLAVVSIFFFIACMFVDSIPVIIIVSPIIYPIAMASGVDPMQLGIVVTIQSVIGCITPPFGCNLFTACTIFKKKFTTVVRGIVPYMVISVIISILLVIWPEFALLSRNLLMQ